jgi:NTP pyrophosphatase (non-canonical NTP hydrolase)
MDDLKHLTEVMHEFVTSKGWYAPDSKRPQTPRSLAISLMLEAGEVLEHFQWDEKSADKEALAEELADVMLYLLQLASLHDIDMYQATRDKLARNLKREWE